MILGSLDAIMLNLTSVRKCSNISLWGRLGSLDEIRLNLHVFGKFFLSCNVCIYIVYVENVRIL